LMMNTGYKQHDSLSLSQRLWIGLNGGIK
jgi:hypothetical protein